jgi:ubiquinone/menaquinone biosynthesis C-methylase UbiE
MTEKLLQHNINFIGVDLNENCIEYCKNKFLDNKNVVFYKNNGLTLPMIEDNSINFVFSWDSFVHMHKNVVESYLVELNRVLKIRGYAFIHHANFSGGTKHSIKNLAGRANLNPKEVVEMCKKNNLEVLSQKFIDWSSENFELYDTVSIIKKV